MTDTLRARLPDMFPKNWLPPTAGQQPLSSPLLFRCTQAIIASLLCLVLFALLEIRMELAEAIIRQQCFE